MRETDDLTPTQFDRARFNRFGRLRLRRGALHSLIAIAAMDMAGCSRPRPDPRMLAPLVAQVVVGDVDSVDQNYTGTIRSRVESDLGFRVAGKVTARLVDAGETVRKGQSLMRLDPNDLSLTRSAQASNVDAARARSVQADADLARVQGLVEKGAISAQSYDQTKAAADSARALLAAARSQADVAGNARGYAVLTADADGVVQDTLAEPGQVVTAGQTVVKLAHAGPREAAVNLPETLRPTLGSTAVATLYGRASPFSARLRQLSQQADTGTRTYEARYVLSGQGAVAPLGSTVVIRIGEHGAAAAGVSVPLGAVYDPGTGPGVWRLTDARVSFRPIKIVSLSEETAVIEGVEPGERIVALGANLLRQGEQVRVAPIAPARP